MKKDDIPHQAIIEEDEDQNEDKEGKIEIIPDNLNIGKEIQLDDDDDEFRESNAGPLGNNNRFTTIDSGKFSEPVPQNPQGSNQQGEQKNILTEPLETHNFKILLVGEFGSGKTSIINRFIDNKFESTSLQIPGNNQGGKERQKTINIDQHTAAILSIFDTAGEEQYATLAKSYYIDLHGVLLVFDLTNEQSYNKIESWVEEIGKYAPKDVVMMLVGNKSDLSDNKITFQKTTSLSQKLNVMFYETSAKNGSNVALVFEMITNKIIARQSEVKPGDKVVRKEGRATLGLNDIKNHNFAGGEKQKKKCCGD